LEFGSRYGPHYSLTFVADDIGLISADNAIQATAAIRSPNESCGSVVAMKPSMPEPWQSSERFYVTIAVGTACKVAIG
jgi:hypothetical protein